jgi:chromosome segregation ATPase
VQKLDAWADDLKLGLEQEIKEIDREVKEVRRTAATPPTLEEKLAHQKRQRELESKRSKLRRELFARQDEIEAQRNDLISQLEAQLQQQVEERTSDVVHNRMGAGMMYPSEALTDLIASLLVERKLFLQEDAQKYRDKIAIGTMKPEDWLLAIEKALQRGGRIMNNNALVSLQIANLRGSVTTFRLIFEN